MPRVMHADSSEIEDRSSRFDSLRSKWGWFAGLGLVLLVLGLFAFGNLFVATLASVFYFGVAMMFGAVAHVVSAFQVRRWGAFFLWLLAGVLYGAAAVFIFYNPALAAQALTIATAIALLFAGIVRIAAALRARPLVGWGWLALSGLTTLLLGVLIAVGWPANTLWLLGLFLAIDLTIQGVATLAFAVALRRTRTRAQDSRIPWDKGDTA